MGVGGWLRATAAGGDVPVFALVGAGARHLADQLALLPRVRVVDSPRHAAVLVVLGRVPRALLHPMMAVHDQLSPPRATVWWAPDGDTDVDMRAVIPTAVVDRDRDRDHDGERLRQVFSELLRGGRASEPPALMDVEPSRWRGVGRYGQGGTGMTGGVPYGRPLPGRASDPDGLQLDQLPLRVGPVFPPFPPGLVLDLEVQGDVVRSAAVGDNPFAVWPGDPPAGPLDTRVFLEALTRPVSVADLELARARHHLRWLAHALRVHGLGARGRAVLALASSLSADDAATVAALGRRVGRDRGLAWATSGVGAVPAEAFGAGPVGRAAGAVVDARLDDPSYRGLAVEPVVHGDGDAWARLRQRVAEAAQAVGLAHRAGERVREPGPPLEGPRGALGLGRPMPSSALVSLLPALLEGQEWGDAVTTVVSLDVDLEEAAVADVAVAQP